MSDIKQRILINATQPEESRIALVSEENSKYHLYDVEYERKGYEQRLGHLYCGHITRIEKHLDAVFFDYGGKRQGFLPNREIDPNYYEDGKLRVGQKMLVQIKKEERGNKGAALSSFISLAGSYMVLMPNNPRAGGISRRIEGEDRSELREILSNLDVPENMGIIIRTAGISKSKEDLQWDLNVLLQQWKAIETAYKESEGPQLIYQESDLTIRAIRDHLRSKIDEIWVDQPEVYKRIKNYLQQIRPDYVNRLKLYKRQTPLFTHYQVESQIESAFQRNVVLPSGGAIALDHTEALTAIDVNSARATTGSDIEETALNTNLEAVEEVARQLRLRDIGGLVVLDLIDMGAVANRQRVEQHLTEILQARDPARVQVGRISRFGLLEMSRQRLRPSLGESSQETCPRCLGEGHIRGIEPLALAIMRLLSEYAMEGENVELRAFVPIHVASYLMNEKRNTITKIEQDCEVKIVIVPTPSLETPHYKIDCIMEDTLSTQSPQSSYQLNYVPPNSSATNPANLNSETPAVANIHTTQNSGMNINIVKRLWHSVFGDSKEEVDVEPPVTTPTKPRTTRHKTSQTGTGGNKRHTGNRSDATRKRTPSSSSRSTSSSSRPAKGASSERTQTEETPTQQRDNKNRGNHRNTKREENSQREESSKKPRSRPKPHTEKKVAAPEPPVDTGATSTAPKAGPEKAKSKPVVAPTEGSTFAATKETAESKPRSRRQTRRKRTASPPRTAQAKSTEQKDENAQPVEQPKTEVSTQPSPKAPAEVEAKETSTAKTTSRRRGRYVRVRKGTPRPKPEQSTQTPKENSE